MDAMQQTSSDTNCEREKRFTSQVSSCQSRLNFTSTKNQQGMLCMLRSSD